VSPSPTSAASSKHVPAIPRSLCLPRKALSPLKRSVGNTSPDQGHPAFFPRQYATVNCGRRCFRFSSSSTMATALSSHEIRLSPFSSARDRVSPSLNFPVRTPGSMNAAGLR